MKLKRITNSNNKEIQQLIALHSETFPEYEKFQGIPLLANLINNAQSMQYNGVYEDEKLVPYNEITTRRFNFYKRNGFKELANNPETLSDVCRGGHSQWLMGTQDVDNLIPYLIKIRDNVYYATGE